MKRFTHLLITLAMCAACSKEPAATVAQESSSSKQATSGGSGAGDSPGAKLALQRTTGSSRTDRTIDLAQAAAKKNPDNAALWIKLGHGWIRKARESADPGFYLNANACADQVLARTPDSRLALNLKALVLLNEHRFQEARTLARSIVERAADDAMAQGSLSDAELELGLYDEAATSAQAMMDLKPNLPSYSRASYLSWLRGDTQGAKQAIKLAIDSGRDRHDPEPRAWVLTQAAMIFLHEGDVEGAEAGFDMTLAWLPDYPPALVGKGRVALLRGEGARAVDLLSRAYQESPLVETAWLLGDAKGLAGDRAGALEMFAKVKSDGKKTDPRALSLFLSTRDEDHELALSLAEQEYAVRKDVYTEDARAWALFRAGRTKDALASITRARRLGTPDARLVFHEGAIRMAAGEVEKGRALVNLALTLKGGLDPEARRQAQATAGQTTAGKKS